jgi:hypothetical protein
MYADYDEIKRELEIMKVRNLCLPFLRRGLTRIVVCGILGWRCGRRGFGHTVTGSKCIKSESATGEITRDPISHQKPTDVGGVDKIQGESEILIR